MRHLIGAFEQPRVHLDGPLPQIEVVLRKKSGHLLVHLVNTSGVPVSAEFRHTGVVIPTPRKLPFVSPRVLRRLWFSPPDWSFRVVMQTAYGAARFLILASIRSCALRMPCRLWLTFPTLEVVTH